MRNFSVVFSASVPVTVSTVSPEAGACSRCHAEYAKIGVRVVDRERRGSARVRVVVADHDECLPDHRFAVVPRVALEHRLVFEELHVLGRFEFLSFAFGEQVQRTEPADDLVVAEQFELLDRAADHRERFVARGEQRGRDEREAPWP